jgi:8-amino-7-oxononanoate synthase
LPSALEQLQQQGLRRKLGVRAAGGGPQLHPPQGESLVNFASNDYLGLATHPAVRQAAASAAADWGVGAGASPVVSGRTHLHQQLEQRLADLCGRPATLTFSSGFAAGVGVIPALVGPGDAIYSDQLNHASLIDGCRLSRAERHIYRHGDVEHLASLLQNAANGGRRLIVTDTLFSMGGDLAPLVALGQLAEQYGAMLLVDEAHAVGVLGPRGGGLVEALAAEHPRLNQQVTVVLGTLSKALGCAGAFVATDAPLIDWLANRARSYVFSTALPLPVVAAVLAALDTLAGEAQLRLRLAELSQRLRQQLAELGCNTANSASQIIPVVIGPPEATMQLHSRLRQAGLWVPGIRPPTVPVGQSQLRVSLRADHTDEHLERLVAALAEPMEAAPRRGCAHEAENNG